MKFNPPDLWKIIPRKNEWERISRRHWVNSSNRELEITISGNNYVGYNAEVWKSGTCLHIGNNTSFENAVKEAEEYKEMYGGYA